MGRIATSSSSSASLLLLSLAFFFIMLSLPLRCHSQLNSEKKIEWPCCDSCNICTKSIPPYCVCDDLLPSCPPMCENCDKVDPDSGASTDPPLYRCLDFLLDPCQQPCASASSILNQ